MESDDSLESNDKNGLENISKNKTLIPSALWTRIIQMDIQIKPLDNTFNIQNDLNSLRPRTKDKST